VRPIEQRERVVIAGLGPPQWQVGHGCGLGAWSGECETGGKGVHDSWMPVGGVRV
jgi:hypothetical protein